MLDHHIFVWTNDDFISDVLCFAVQRLGYSCSLFSWQAWNERMAQDAAAEGAAPAQHMYAYYLFIVGPQVPLDQLDSVIEQAQQASLACQVKVVLLTDRSASASTLRAADEQAYHTLPLNLGALHTTLHDMIAASDDM
jgi:DNA-binding response OmpR family regulator